MSEASNTVRAASNLVTQHIQHLKRTQFRDLPLCAYIYDLDELNEHLEQQVLEHLPKQCQMFYAVKANAEIPVLSVFAKHCYGFEVASLGELEKIRTNFPEIPVVFGGPGKTDAELKACLQYRVQFVHVESLHELLRLESLCQDANQSIQILLRLNLKFENFSQTRLTMGGKPSPFGMDETMLHSCLSLLAHSRYIQLKGLHFHLASFQVDEYRHAALITQYIHYLHKLNQRYQFQLNYLNVGGGIGVDYDNINHRFDWALFFKLLNATLETQKSDALTIYFECGRSLSVYCGYYAAEVLDIKESHGEYFVVVRGGTHHFRTPYAQSHSHPFNIISVKDWYKDYSRISVNNRKINIVGQLCTPKDVLAYNQTIEHIALGDIVLFSHAGAYAWNISHHDFLCHPHPEHYFLGANE